jgi:uncharacterized glyoxalase superfamily protein PhnB
MTYKSAAIGLVAQDLRRTLQFYEALGLDVPPDAYTAPHVELALPGGFRLMIDPVDTVRAFDPGWTPPTGSPGASLAFECDSAADVDEKYAELVDAGYEGHLAPWDAFWGQRYAILRDPDGTGVDLFAPLPSR